MATVTPQGNDIHTSGDLPEKGHKAPDFTLTRADLSDVTLSDFEGKKKILNIVTLSQMRDKACGKDFGVEIVDGPLAGILCMAIITLSTDNQVLHTDLVPEIAQEPDYDAALKSIS